MSGAGVCRRMNTRSPPRARAPLGVNSISQTAAKMIWVNSPPAAAAVTPPSAAAEMTSGFAGSHFQQTSNYTRMGSYCTLYIIQEGADILQSPNLHTL